MDKLSFLRELSYKVNKLKGNKPFNLSNLMNDNLVQQYLYDIDNLIDNGFFFLKRTDNGKYKKTYRIPEICNRTVLELEKENINPKILKLIKKYPLILHTEFERWLRTKHKSMLSYILDKYWHNFMLYSYEYNSWCIDNFGYLVNHIPTPDYENENLSAEDIIIDHAEYFFEYRKMYPISKTILLYNFPYKLIEEKLSFKEIKNIIFDLISELKVNNEIDEKLDNNKLKLILKTIKKELNKNGYIVLKNKLTLNEYHYVCKKLGSIINITNIEVNHNSDRKFNSHKSMPLHTDAHDVDIVSWFCQEQDLRDGTILLKSLRQYYKFFNKQEIEILKRIKIKYPIYKRFYTGEYPLLRDSKFYYAPWLEKNKYSKRKQKILNKFKTFIENQKVIKIKFNKGDILFLDNLSIIHGRDKIGKNSKRLLYRTHISLR